MAITEIRAQSILRRFRRIDSWFVAKSGLNLYRGCAHDCAYCDGRAEKYRVEGEFGRDIAVKVNALEVLGGELVPKRRGTAPRWSGYVVLGGGVGDSYQPVEAEYRLARRSLELFESLGVPVHVLTKSTLVLRDADILARLAGSGHPRAIVSFSLSSADDGVSAVFEPGVPPPSERLAAIRALAEQGVPAGVFLLPVIPFVTDSREMVSATLAAASAAGARWVLFGGMTLKEGRQKEHFLSVLSRLRPELVPRYRELYAGDQWGAAVGDYDRRLTRMFGQLAREHCLLPRIPRTLFEGLVREEDLPVVLLDQINAMLQMLGEPARRDDAAAGLAEEIGRTGTARLYEDLLSRFSPGAAR